MCRPLSELNIPVCQHRTLPLFIASHGCFSSQVCERIKSKSMSYDHLLFLEHNLQLNNKQQVLSQDCTWSLLSNPYHVTSQNPLSLLALLPEKSLFHQNLWLDLRLQTCLVAANLLGSGSWIFLNKASVSLSSIGRKHGLRHVQLVFVHAVSPFSLCYLQCFCHPIHDFLKTYLFLFGVCKGSFQVIVLPKSPYFFKSNF